MDYDIMKFSILFILPASIHIIVIVLFIIFTIVIHPRSMQYLYSYLDVAKHLMVRVDLEDSGVLDINFGSWV